MSKRSDNPSVQLSDQEDAHQQISDQEEPQRKRVRLNLGQKIEAARKLVSGMSTAVVAKEYGCSVRAMKNIKRDSSRFLQLNKAEATALHLKSLRPPKFLMIDSKLLEFVHFSRVAKIPLSLSVLKARAIFLRDELLKQNTLNTKMRNALQSFSVSDGWVSNFVKRFGLRSFALHGKDAEADSAAVAKGVAELTRTLHGYSVDCIYNLDETSLFYKLLPRRSYITTDGNHKSVRNTANMTSQDRITAYLCANADGTRKVPLAIIGAMKHPLCFDETQPISYFHQKSAWSDTATFRRWFQSVFLPFVREHTSNPVALVMSSCGPHGTDVMDSQGQVTILTLPRSCATLRLPMGTGITEIWKLGYRQELLMRLVANATDREERRKFAEHFKPGMKGISEGHYANLFDASEMILSSWDAVSTEEIALCWMKTNILPTVIHAKLASLHGQTKMVRPWKKKSPMLKNVTKLLSELLGNLLPQDPIHEEVESVSQNDVERWLNLEEDMDISEAVLNDLLHEIELNSFDHATMGGNLPADATNMCNGDVAVNGLSSIPRPGHMAHMFQRLEELAMSTGLSEAFVHLRRAKRALMEAYDEQSKASP